MAQRGFMPIRSVVFDIGGVLERVDDVEAVLGAAWRERLGVSPEKFRGALAAIRPHKLSQTGHMSEAEWAARRAARLPLLPAPTDEIPADALDWDCGEPAEGRMAVAPSLRP